MEMAEGGKAETGTSGEVEGSREVLLTRPEA